MADLTAALSELELEAHRLEEKARALVGTLQSDKHPLSQVLDGVTLLRLGREKLTAARLLYDAPTPSRKLKA